MKTDRELIRGHIAFAIGEARKAKDTYTRKIWLVVISELRRLLKEE